MNNSTIKFFIFTLIFFNCSFSNAQGRTYVDSVFGVINKLPNDTVKVNKLIQESVSRMNGDSATTLPLLRAANSISKQINFKTGIIKSYGLIARIYNEYSSYSNALVYFDSLFKFINPKKESRLYTKYMSWKSHVYLDKSMFWAAIDIIDSIIPIQMANQDSDQLSVSYTNLGTAYENLSTYLDSSSKYFNKSFAIDSARKNEGRIVQAYINLGSLHLNVLMRMNSISDSVKAFSYYKKALEKSVEKNDTMEIIFIRNILGIAQNTLKNYGLAIKNLDYGLNLFNNSQHKDSLVFIQLLGNKLIAYQGLGRIDSILPQWLNLLRIAKKYGRTADISEALMSVGLSYSNSGDYKKSAKYFLEAMDSARKVEKNNLVQDVAQNLADVYEKNGDYMNALRSYKLYDSIRNILVDEHQINQVDDLSIRYETAEQKKQIAERDAKIKGQAAQRNLIFLIVGIVGLIVGAIIFYRRTQAAKKLKTLIIETQNREKKNVADELHGVSSSLVLTQRQIESIAKRENIDDNIKVSLNSILKRLDSVREFTRSVSYNIMPQSFWTKGLEQALKDHFEELNSIVGKRAIFRSTGLKTRFSSEAELDIFRTVSELTSNTLIHNSDFQEISLIMREESQQLVLTLEDDGTGFDADQALISESIGWKSTIRSSIEEKYRGAISVESSPNAKGSMIVLRIPIQTLKKFKAVAYMKHSIYIVDDERFYVESLLEKVSKINTLRVLGSSWYLDHALKDCESLRPDILMTDLRMPKREDGYNLIRQVKSKVPSMRVICFTHDIYPSLILDFEKLQWNGLIHKADISENTIEEACDKVCNNEFYFSEKIREDVAKKKINEEKFQFTKGEKEILTYLYRGLSNEQIADMLGYISKEGVKDRVENILEECNEHYNGDVKLNRKLLPKFLLDNGLIDPE